MSNKPLIDRPDIEKIIKAAKRERAEYMRRKFEKPSIAVRWGGLSVLIASAVAFIGSGLSGHR
jgi:hypothetical protein